MSDSNNQTNNQTTPPPPPGARNDLVDWTIAEQHASNRTDPLGFVWDITSNPCFRRSMMWGIGVGGALGVHNFTRYRSHIKASSTAVYGFMAVASGTWLWCRYQAREEKKLFDAVVDAELQTKEKRRQAALAAKAETAQHQT